MSNNNKDKNMKKITDAIDAMKMRLDVIVSILIKQEFGDKNGKIKISGVAPLLHRAGYSPTEIAKFFGKKKPSEIAPFLYIKKK